MITAKVRVLSVRHRGEFGGAIFTGYDEELGKFVVKIHCDKLQDSSLIQKGQVWKVTGLESTVIYKHGYNIIEEQQIEADKLFLLRPRGENIIHFIAESDHFPNIGTVKAKKLWETFGEDLIEHIEKQNRDLLSTVLSNSLIDTLIAGFKHLKDASVLLFLDKFSLDPKIGHKVIQFYGEETKAKINEDPYRLISFGAKWDEVDKYALEILNIEPSAPVRLVSAIEQILQQSFHKLNTAISYKILYSELHNILGDSSLTDMAIEYAHREKRILIKGTHLIQSLGTHVIEKSVTDKIKFLLTKQRADITLSTFGEVLQSFESSNKIRLTHEQKEALKRSIKHNFSLITGGAGVGKTTILKALYHIIRSEKPERQIIQLALSGKATKQLFDSTNLESCTIASFLFKQAKFKIKKNALIVIDEASMVDINLFYRLFKLIPNESQVILVGDPYQLPPIGPGLLFHELVKIDLIPQSKLSIIKRQLSSTGIPQFSSVLRKHKLPFMETYNEQNEGVSYIHCSIDQIEAHCLSLYQTLSQSSVTTILSATRNGAAGVNNLNQVTQALNINKEKIKISDPINGSTSFLNRHKHEIKTGDPVMFTKNDYSSSLRNGSLGTVLQSYECSSPSSPACVVDFEGEEHLLKFSELEHLELAYAITVHKSQGSQFDKIIVPIRESKILDHSLIYTAVTRAVKQVIFVGDMNILKSTVESYAQVWSRITAIKEHLSK